MNFCMNGKNGEYYNDNEADEAKYEGDIRDDAATTTTMTMTMTMVKDSHYPDDRIAFFAEG